LLHACAQALEGAGRSEQAADAYGKVVAARPDDLIVRLYHARLLAQLKRWDEAADAYARALDRSADPVATWSGIIPSDALGDRVMTQRPNDATPWRLRGQRAADVGDWKRAITSFQEVTRRDDKDASTWAQLGHAHANLAEWDAAAKAYLHALALTPPPLSSDW